MNPVRQRSVHGRQKRLGHIGRNTAKALDSITEEEHAAIYRKWVPIRYDHGFDYTILWQALAVFAVILGAMIIWNRKLSREIQSRQKAEKALKKSEFRFRQLFDFAPVPLTFVSNDEMRFDVNEQFVETFGFTREEIPTLAAWRELAYPDPEYRVQVAEVWQEALRETDKRGTITDPIELYVTCRDGAVRTVIVSGTLIGRDYLAVLVDITESKRAEEALRESEEQFRAMSEYSHNAIIIVDEGTGILWVNPKAAELTGYTEEKLLGAESFTTIVASESMDFVMSNYQNFLAGENYEHHYRFYCIRADGEKRLMEKSMTDYTDRNSRRNLIMNLTDITERQLAEEALKESEQLFRTLVEGAPDAIFVQTDQRFAYLNRSALDLMGLDSEEQVLGLPVLDWIHPSSRDTINEHIRRSNQPRQKDVLHEGKNSAGRRNIGAGRDFGHPRKLPGQQRRPGFRSRYHRAKTDGTPTLAGPEDGGNRYAGRGRVS